MAKMQACYVCNEWDTLSEDRILVRADDRFAERRVALCPVCERFICTEHGEKLDLSRKKPRKGSPRKDAMLTLCCPFDPDVPLGDAPSQYPER